MRFLLSVAALALFSATLVLAESSANGQAPNTEKAAVAGGHDAGLGAVKAQAVVGNVQGLGGGKSTSAKEKRREEEDGEEHRESDEPDHDDHGDRQEELEDKLEDDP
ncbi:hypothetical protein BDB00DRAFT_804975 [Zychaea mexicana]|uniref:uncharacterized protein n=1 Tax=Zychaea mexicana TaxID=64656 RepID=UPI0022FE6F96|nr:uncharacterized protein BDB00DRAFT_804975 [Zychaea mexicana]KAI9497532.1 hypothetical protein BDB00DRAFT_804975 [Zychaea mexicana]